MVANTRGVGAAVVGTAVAARPRVGEALGVGDPLVLGDGAPTVVEALGVARACDGRRPMTTVATTTMRTRTALATATTPAARGMRMPHQCECKNRHVDERAAKLVSAWLEGLSLDGRRTLYSLLDEVCKGIDVSRHNPFGFLRLRAEFETSGELFGCTLPDLRDAVAASLGPDLLPTDRPRSALESLRDEIASRGHPDFR